MKKIKNAAAQGDVFFIRRESLPDGATKSKTVVDRVVAHSETGHHHVALGAADYYKKPGDDMLAWLVTNQPVVVEHRRSFDTHEALELLADGGGEVIWEIRRQREHTPKGWRQVVD